MCGIAGIYHYGSEAPVDREILGRMTRSLSHRGPDDEGYYLAGRVGLGHRRLSIIDPALGHQPIFNETGTMAVIANGEIYNYRELKRWLEQHGHRFTSHSDTETIVHLFEEEGEACLGRLDGMFALAIWDGRENRLLLARDRIGKKPLYYAMHEGRFLFGSELKAIVSDPRIPREIDEEALADYFTYQFIPAPRTIYRHVRKLPAGHLLIVTPGGVSERRYWEIDFRQTEDVSEDEWAGRVTDCFARAVEKRLLSDVPLGAFLSSGIDSSAVVAMMQRGSLSAVRAVTVGFAERNYDETQEARRFARQLGVIHEEQMVTPRVSEILPRLVAHFDEPFADASAVPTYYLSRAARQFMTVALSGDGGDENFAGYRRHRFDWLENRWRSLIPGFIRRPLLGALAEIYPATARLPRPLRAKATLRNLAAGPAEAYFNSVYGAMAFERDALLGERLRENLHGYDPFTVFDDLYRRAPADDALGRAQYVDLKLYLADDILTKVDRMSMAVGLEVRCPLLDRELMELAARMPAGVKLRGGEGKAIFKRAMRGLLPDEVLRRRKRGFVVPIGEWLRGELREFARSRLFDARADDGWLRVAALRDLWEDHQAGRRDYSRALWAVLIFRIWQERMRT